MTPGGCGKSCLAPRGPTVGENVKIGISLLAQAFGEAVAEIALGSVTIKDQLGLGCQHGSHFTKKLGEGLRGEIECVSDVAGGEISRTIRLKVPVKRRTGALRST